MTDLSVTLNVSWGLLKEKIKTLGLIVFTYLFFFGSMLHIKLYKLYNNGNITYSNNVHQF